MLVGPRGATFEDVHRIGTQRYEIGRSSRSLPDGGSSPAWRQLRDGYASGLLLAGVRPDTVFSALGLASGDVLAEVNGRSIATPDAALAAYAALQTADHFSLVIERGGRRVRLDYVIR